MLKNKLLFVRALSGPAPQTPDLARPPFKPRSVVLLSLCRLTEFGPVRVFLTHLHSIFIHCVFLRNPPNPHPGHFICIAQSRNFQVSSEAASASHRWTCSGLFLHPSIVYVISVCDSICSYLILWRGNNAPDDSGVISLRYFL